MQADDIMSKQMTPSPMLTRQHREHLAPRANKKSEGTPKQTSSSSPSSLCTQLLALEERLRANVRRYNLSTKIECKFGKLESDVTSIQQQIVDKFSEYDSKILQLENKVNALTLPCDDLSKK